MTKVKTPKRLSTLGKLISISTLLVVRMKKLKAGANITRPWIAFTTWFSRFSTYDSKGLSSTPSDNKS